MQKLGKTLVERGLITGEQLDGAHQRAQASRQSLEQVLVSESLVSDADLLSAMADAHGLATVDLKSAVADRKALKSLSPKLALHYSIVPLTLSADVLTIAVADPHDLSAVDDIEATLGVRVERVLASKPDVLLAIRKYYGVGAGTVERILADSPERREVAVQEESHNLETMAEDASVVSLVNQLLEDAIDDRATDIHFEASRDEVIVRRRIDGILYDTSIAQNMKLLYPAIVSRIKLMSSLNIVERRLPQDGRARVNIRGEQFDLRISIVPAIHGEDVVIRILPATMLFDLGRLGLSPKYQELMEDLIGRPHGILFVTGPTGSGKSTTLYACLRRLNCRERKIITIEDPVEYELKGITQTQVNTGIGMSFSHSLRAMLRHDPDVMMIGEVRDRETADIAIQTAMTGHFVLSTLHTNDAAGGPVRLMDMGVEPFLITSTVQAFIAQRLVRLICESCKVEFEEDGQKRFKGEGCERCNQSGYQGRVAICEFLPLEVDIQEVIMRRGSASELREKADALGMETLAHDGWDKVERGLTTAEEVVRVTSI